MASLIPGTLLLAARTARSQAYVQAMNAAGLRTESLLIYGEPGLAQKIPEGVATRPAAPATVHLPDLGEPLAASAEAGGWRTDYVAAAALDDAGLLAAVRARAPQLIIFSGYPAQMVPASITAIAPVLHFHSGALPAFRGSTTLYYSLLEGQLPAVTALLVDGGIDSGKIVAMQNYPPPPPGLDIDYIYDGAIRADLLTRVMGALQQRGQLPDAPPPATASERLYFIIHPILKHLALASLTPRPHDPAAP